VTSRLVLVSAMSDTSRATGSDRRNALAKLPGNWIISELPRVMPTVTRATDKADLLLQSMEDAELRTEYDGTITVLAETYNGKRINSPNDLVVKSDNSIWFTDPPFGIAGYYQGVRAPQELPDHIYRIDGGTGALSIVADDVDGPNGLAFSPDESKLYVIESRSRPRTVRVFNVTQDGARLSHSRVLIDAGPGTPDGFRVDVDGNLWCGWGMGDSELDGVRVFNPDGTPIGHISLPERCANLCFGGPWRNRLFMASCTSIYALYVNTQGAPGG
jgi:gluconolactonase